MNIALARHPALERLLARALAGGTWLGSSLIAIGLVLALVGAPLILTELTGERLVTAGVVVFLALPVLRVLLMLIVFVHEKDYRFAAIAALVLATIICGAVLGTHMSIGAG